MHSMTLTPSSTVILALTSVVLINAALTSALPSSLRQPASLNIGTAAEMADSKAKSATSKTLALPKGVTTCPGGYYFSEESVGCQPCSKCPINQIIRRPCSELADTRCGPFFEFDTFHQSPAEKTSREDEREKQWGEGQMSGNRVREPFHSQASGSEDCLEADDQSAVSLRKANDQWRALSFALIAVLSFICCIVVVVGLYVYVILRRAQTQKLIVREPELLAPPYPYPDVDSEPRYVETFVTSRDAIKTMRQSPVYQQIVTRCDASEAFTPLTSSAYDVKTDGAVTGVDDRERLCVYVNTDALIVGES